MVSFPAGMSSAMVALGETVVLRIFVQQTATESNFAAMAATIDRYARGCIHPHVPDEASDRARTNGNRTGPSHAFVAAMTGIL